MAKILLVEDNDANRIMLARRLQRNGHEVVTAADGEQAVALARDAGPDVIIMDLDLPILDGWAATRRLKASTATGSIPVIALTAHAMSSDRGKALDAGCDDYDTKPIEMPRLLGKIEALVHPGAAPAPAHGQVRAPAAPPAPASASAPSPSAPPSAPVVGLGGVPSPSSPPRRVLVVDDTEANRRMVQRRLRRHGFEVEAANDGETALKLLAERPYDAVLLDVMMPGMSGVEVLKEIRRTRPPTDLPVIMATAKGASEDVVESLAAGANDYVTKPLDFPVVLARLNTHLSLKKSVDQIRKLEQGLEQRNRELQAANERLRADLDAAGKVQAALLPSQQPPAPGYQFRWLFRPSSALGGDILNIFRLDDGHVGLYVLDVSGHGVAAALLSVTVSHFLSPLPDPSSLLWESVQGGWGDGCCRLEPPARVAQRLNSRFPFDYTALQFFTLVYGVLDLQTHELRYVSAGHPNLIHQPKGEAPRALDASGFPIGLGNEDYAEFVVPIGPGDRLYAFSDGILEALNPDLEAFGQRRVLDALEASRDEPIDISLHVLSTRVEQWAGTGERRDDQSVVVMERTVTPQ